MTAQQRNNDLEILEERVMGESPRGRDGTQCLRVRFVEAQTPEGKKVAWHDVREYFRADDGVLRPTRKGISIRGGELGMVAVALLRACRSRIPATLDPLMKELVAALLGGGTETPAPQATRRPEHRRTIAPRPGAPLTEHGITEDDRNF